MALQQAWKVLTFPEGVVARACPTATRPSHSLRTTRNFCLWKEALKHLKDRTGSDWCRLFWRFLYQQQERPARKELSWMKNFARHRKLAIWMCTAQQSQGTPLSYKVCSCGAKLWETCMQLRLDSLQRPLLCKCSFFTIFSMTIDTSRMNVWKMYLRFYLWQMTEEDLLDADSTWSALHIITLHNVYFKSDWCWWCRSTENSITIDHYADIIW